MVIDRISVRDSKEEGRLVALEFTGLALYSFGVRVL